MDGEGELVEKYIKGEDEEMERERGNEERHREEEEEEVEGEEEETDDEHDLEGLGEVIGSVKSGPLSKEQFLLSRIVSLALKNKV